MLISGTILTISMALIGVITLHTIYVFCKMPNKELKKIFLVLFGTFAYVVFFWFFFLSVKRFCNIPHFYTSLSVIFTMIPLLISVFYFNIKIRRF